MRSTSTSTSTSKSTEHEHEHRHLDQGLNCVLRICKFLEEILMKNKYDSLTNAIFSNSTIDHRTINIQDGKQDHRDDDQIREY
jgi:hypothetical protein